jgi:hypothetical protein
MGSFRTSPKVRFAVRSIVVAGLGYLTTVLATGFADGFAWSKLLVGLLGALAGAAYAAIGAATPVEPFVGVKPSAVEVPQPPAVPEPT